MTHLHTSFVIPCLTRNPVFLLDSRFRGNDNSCGLTYELLSNITLTDKP